jgi:hypothetical protein
MVQLRSSPSDGLTAEKLTLGPLGVRPEGSVALTLQPVEVFVPGAVIGTWYDGLGGMYLTRAAKLLPVELTNPVKPVLM